MSSNISLAQPTIVWNEKTVLENGIPFLNQKKEELNLYQDLWNASKGNEFYNNLSKTAGEKYKLTAEKSIKEIEILDKTVTQLLDAELAKNPSSEQAKQLSKIALSSHHGLNYFTSAFKDTYYPTHLNWGLREAAWTSNKLAVSTTVLTGAAWLASNIADYALPSYYSIPWKVSMTAFITFNAIRFLNICYRINPAEQQVNDLKNVFEKAIAPEKVTKKSLFN